MEIKTQTTERNTAADTKKSNEKLPKRSFKEVMARKEIPRLPRRKETVFDIAAKEKKKDKEPPKESNQGAEGAVELALSEVGEALEIVEVSPVEITSLVEEMADYIKIESDNGVSKTTVKVGMEGTIFEGTEVAIDHYDTAPHSFNIQLMGSPEALDLFQNHLGALQTSLNAHEVLKGFQIHLMRPILSERSELYLRGKTREEKKREVFGKGIGSPTLKK